MTRQQAECCDRVCRLRLCRRHRARRVRLILTSIREFGPAVSSTAGLSHFDVMTSAMPADRAQVTTSSDLRHARPVVAGAEEAADRAGLDAQRVGLLESHPGIIGVAAGTAVDVAGPLRIRLRLHVAEHGLALWCWWSRRGDSRTAPRRMSRFAPCPSCPWSANRRAANHPRVRPRASASVRASPSATNPWPSPASDRLVGDGGLDGCFSLACRRRLRPSAQLAHWPRQARRWTALALAPRQPASPAPGRARAAQQARARPELV